MFADVVFVMVQVSLDGEDLVEEEEDRPEVRLTACIYVIIYVTDM